MLNALLRHYVLVITGRHDGTGVSNKLSVVNVCIIALAIALSLLRWYPDSSGIAAVAFFGLVLGTAGVRYTVLYSMLSTGIDLAALFLNDYTEFSYTRPVLSVVELLLVVILILRVREKALVDKENCK